ncbi:7-cyano-7-deazaguanine synthase [Aromatoleum toluclasticum]|uniref:7-cyano-7-deazaguanine synthase n=1 Tax=Aromatoleum toluclasticum TaxID=92003 RepID=UPI001D1949FE|nr:7-cyano-7-deazaguanine synthase [Aromatoleum toluclasticum]MCC4113885.1 7-cyano-7-deazaguanine synthase [Aromatoleum toluclasticum]
MSIVTLVSGGLDSTLVAKLAQEEGLRQHPLFIDYGQRSRDRELAACRRAMAELSLPEPKMANLSGFGTLIRTGLTDASRHIVHDAFTPGRNMLFLLTAAAYAYQIDADAVSIGLLHEDTSLFPDQNSAFLADAERMIARCMSRNIRVLAPLAAFHKPDVVALAHEKGIRDTYSCHTGQEVPCGACIACNEFKFEGA